jgi:hypothetical protein
MFVVPVIFKLDGVEPIKESVLVKFELLPNENILIPATVNDKRSEILSHVILFHPDWSASLPLLQQPGP